MRYADPNLCPGCRSRLPHGEAACPTCSLTVRHPLAVELFATLRKADNLVEQLRPVATAPTPTTTPAPLPGHPGTAPMRTAAGQAPYAADRTGLGLAAVPKILLGLGALCLLVAAIVFLAVSWAWLGVGGRTAVLVGLTAAAGGAALLLSRLGLRIAGESLSVVALGLVALDVLGAEAAGWFGSVSDELTVAVAGVVMTVAGTSLALPRFAGRDRLAAPQVAAAIGFLVAYGGLTAGTTHDLVTGHLVVIVGGGVALLARRPLPVQMWGFLVATAWVWVATALLGFVESFAQPDLHALWLGGGAGWSVVASAAVLLAPGAVLRRRDVSVVAGSASALLVTSALTIPCVDESARVVGAVTLAVTAAWTAALRLLPSAVRGVAVAPAVIGSLLLLGLTATTSAVAVSRIGDLGTGNRYDVLLDRPDPITEPLLTVPSALVPFVLLVFLLPRRAVADRAATWWQAGGLVAGLAAVATVASYDVPLLVVVGLLCALSAAGVACGLPTPNGRGVWLGLTGVGIGLVAVAVALPSLPVIAVAAAALLAVAAAAHLLDRQAGLTVPAGITLAPALAVLVWSAGSASHVEAAWLGVPSLALVGVLAIARPRLEVELPAVMVGLVAAVPAVLASEDVGGSLALHLTVAGCLFAATALVHESRRDAAWAGGALLLLATWVRLGDLGVTAPEPYTLPLAVALLVLGLVHLHRHPGSDTVTALLPGLLLGTVPSLLWVLADPLSVRALVLGAGCLALTIAGAVLRWNAPLVVGAAVGGLLVLRELSPYAADIPQWVWIGLAGALLTVVGITWERRLLELRKAVGLLGRLR
jgi:hypothetical protein